jgi:hypothetical protein
MILKNGIATSFQKVASALLVIFSLMFAQAAFAQVPADVSILKKSTQEEILKAFEGSGTFVRENVLGQYILVTVTDGNTSEHVVPGLRRCDIYEFGSHTWIYVGDTDYVANKKSKAQAYMDAYNECSAHSDSYLVQKMPAVRSKKSK